MTSSDAPPGPSAAASPGPNADASRPIERRKVRDREVVWSLVIVVGLVLAADVASALVPGSDIVLARSPVVVIVLLMGTIAVLLGVVRNRRPD
ncbi:MAG: hypothetical protein H0V36_12120 [Chloroflexi bacterium]|nr:hypothetical protein [Chloroflexota bacterium]